MNEAKYNKYKDFYTKDYLMGLNSFLLLDELVNENAAALGGRILDLGCGQALTSIFLANETAAKSVYALDLWIEPTDNMKRIISHSLEDKIIPLKGDALVLPFAKDYFDTIISVDTYHYFGCAEGIFAEKILPFVKKGGSILIAVPGIRYEPAGKELELFKEWAENGDHELFHTAEWWKNHLLKNTDGQIEINVTEGKCYDKAWDDWFKSGNDYGVRDKEYLDKGLYDLLNFVMISIKKV